MTHTLSRHALLLARSSGIVVDTGPPLQHAPDTPQFDPAPPQPTAKRRAGGGGGGAGGGAGGANPRPRPGLLQLPAAAAIATAASADEPEVGSGRGVAAGSPPALLRRLLAVREAMRRRGLRYGRRYWAAVRPGDEEDEAALEKVYVMHIGHPADAEVRARVRSKSMRAYVGHGRASLRTTMALHNHPDPSSRPQRTRGGGGLWMLFAVAFFPAEWTAGELAAARAYWECAHGLPGKLRRFAEIASLFNLQYYVPAAAAEHVDAVHAAQGITPRPADPALFLPTARGGGAGDESEG